MGRPLIDPEVLLRLLPIDRSRSPVAAVAGRIPLWHYERTSEHSTAVQAAAAIAGIVLTAVLVTATILYLRATNRILVESRKSREAAETQASAAQRTIALLQQQFEEQLGIGKLIVKDAIRSTRQTIEYWAAQPGFGQLAAAPGLPPTDRVLPSNWMNALDHVRRISGDGAASLAQVFENLKKMCDEVERTRDVAKRQGAFLYRTPSRAPEFLVSARASLDEAETKLAFAAARTSVGHLGDRDQEAL